MLRLTGVASLSGGLSIILIRAAFEIGILFFRRCPILILRFSESTSELTAVVPVTLFLFERKPSGARADDCGPAVVRTVSCHLISPLQCIGL